MHKIFLISIIVLCVQLEIAVAQPVDLTSVDQFFCITSLVREGKKVTGEQWAAFDRSTGFRKFAESENPFVINTIISTIHQAFGNEQIAARDSVMNISAEEMVGNRRLMFKRQLLENYLAMNENYTSLKRFREDYDFSAFVEKSKSRLFSFLGRPADTSFTFKKVIFHCLTADGKNEDDAIYLDFNLICRLTGEQRINFLAHEFFHNYREKFENHDFNYKCDLNAGLDLIQNEGIADLIDKSEGYNQYSVYMSDSPEMAEMMQKLYDQAQKDMSKLQNCVLKYVEGELPEKEMIDEWVEIVKFNGHPIGFFMANQIVKAGDTDALLKTFQNPYTFFSLYNKAAMKLNLFRFNDEFMGYLSGLTKDYYP